MTNCKDGARNDINYERSEGEGILTVTFLVRGWRGRLFHTPYVRLSLDNTNKIRSDSRQSEKFVWWSLKVFLLKSSYISKRWKKGFYKTFLMLLSQSEDKHNYLQSI